MPMPPEVDLRLPLLKMLSDGRLHQIGEVTCLLADHFGLDEREREERHEASQRPKFGMRVRHAASQLRLAGYLSNREAGVFAITQPGRAALALGPRRMTNRFLRDNSSEYRRHEEECARRKKGLSGAVPWAPPEMEGMVVIVDMLGVKGAGGAPDQARIHKGRRKLLGTTRALLDCNEELRGRYTLSAFSDTIFVTAGSRADGRGGDAPADAVDTLLRFSDVAWRLVVESIKDDVPVRGCVSYGRYYQGARSLFTGPTVDEAARYHGLPSWIGVSAAPSANSILNGAIKRRSDPRNRFYTKYSIPLRSSVEQDAWVVNWPRQYDEEAQGSAMEDMLGRIDEKLGGITDVEAAFKWRNTRKFCTDMLAE